VRTRYEARPWRGCESALLNQSICGQQFPRFVDLADSGTCKADGKGDFWAVLSLMDSYGYQQLTFNGFTTERGENISWARSAVRHLAPLSLKNIGAVIVPTHSLLRGIIAQAIRVNVAAVVGLCDPKTSLAWTRAPGMK
jgi:hypothetical protein